MIKLTRPLCPTELSNIEQELLEKYYKNNKLEIWNDKRIKEPLKKALLNMSFNKCAYCECQINIESKDLTIDHFKAKSLYPHLVIAWENLFPACLRCNRSKNNQDEEIINPCIDNPKDYLCLNKTAQYRLKAKNKSTLGNTTISVLNLNDIDRIMTPRMQITEKLIDKLIEIKEDILEIGIQKKYIKRLENVLTMATKENVYSATTSAHILNNDSYLKIKTLLLDNNKWNDNLQFLEDELKAIAFDFQ